MALVELGRIDEAEDYVEMSRELRPEGDVTAEAQIAIARALILSRRGEFDEAVPLAQEAIQLAEGVQELLNLPDLLLRQAEVLEMAGRIEEAEAALRKAADAAARKGGLVDERRANERLAALTGSEDQSGRLTPVPAHGAPRLRAQIPSPRPVKRGYASPQVSIVLRGRFLLRVTLLLAAALVAVLVLLLVKT